MVGKSVAAMGELAIGMRSGGGGPKFEMGTVRGSGRNTLNIGHSLNKAPTGLAICTIGQTDGKYDGSRKCVTSQIVWHGGKFAACVHASGTALEVGTFYDLFVGGGITVTASSIKIDTFQSESYYAFPSDLNYFWIAWTD